MTAVVALPALVLVYVQTRRDVRYVRRRTYPVLPAAAPSTLRRHAAEEGFVVDAIPATPEVREESPGVLALQFARTVSVSFAQQAATPYEISRVSHVFTVRAQGSATEVEYVLTETMTPRGEGPADSAVVGLAFGTRFSLAFHGAKRQSRMDDTLQRLAERVAQS